MSNDFDNDNDDFESLYHRLKESEARHVLAETQLRESEERFSTLISGIDEHFYVLDQLFRFSFVSLSALRAWKKSPSQVIGCVYLDCFPESQGSVTYDIHCRVMRSRVAERFETISKGLNCWVEVHIAPTRQGGISVGFRDIEARKRAEEAARRSDAKYRALFESIAEGFAILEAVRVTNGQAVDFKIIEVNRAYEIHTGLKDPVGKTLRQLMPHFPAGRLAAYQRVLQTGEPARSEFYIPDTQRWFHGNLARIGEAGSNLVGALCEDITARKVEELALRRAAFSSQNG